MRVGLESLVRGQGTEKDGLEEMVGPREGGAALSRGARGDKMIRPGTGTHHCRGQCRAGFSAQWQPRSPSSSHTGCPNC